MLESYVGVGSCSQAYVRGYSEPAANVGVLEELLMVRHEIAALHGAPSWAHYQACSTAVTHSILGLVSGVLPHQILAQHICMGLSPHDSPSVCLARSSPLVWFAPDHRF